MPKSDHRQETIAALVRRISDLNEQSLTQLSQYISYLKWQEELWNDLLNDDDAARFRFRPPVGCVAWQQSFPVKRLD